MSLKTFIQTVEKDVSDAFHTLETEGEAALTWLWGEAKPIFTAFEPQVVQRVLQTLVEMLQKADEAVLGNSSDNIETWFLNELEVAGHDLFAIASQMGSTLLQMLIGLAKGKLAGA